MHRGRGRRKNTRDFARYAMLSSIYKVSTRSRGDYSITSARNSKRGVWNGLTFEEKGFDFERESERLRVDAIDLIHELAEERRAISEWPVLCGESVRVIAMLDERIKIQSTHGFRTTGLAEPGLVGEVVQLDGGIETVEVERA